MADARGSGRDLARFVGRKLKNLFLDARRRRLTSRLDAHEFACHVERTLATLEAEVVMKLDPRVNQAALWCEVLKQASTRLRRSLPAEYDVSYGRARMIAREACGAIVDGEVGGNGTFLDPPART